MATNMNTYERKPINEIKMPYDAIKAYDTSTEFKVELYSKDEKVKVNDIAFFIMSQNDDEFTSVTNYSVKDGTVTFTIPKIKEGKYYPQIMDNTGRVFSSDTNTFIDVVYNSESRALEVFPIIKDQIIKELTPQIKQYVMDNADIFMGNSGIVGHKGDKGDQGVQGKRGFKGNRGKKGDQGIQGIQGVQGERGFTGNRGKKGEQGVQGEKGEKGDKGDKGEDGNVDFDALTDEQLFQLTPEFVLEENGDLYYQIRERTGEL